MEMHRRHRRTYTGARQRGHNSPAARFNRRSACQPQFSLLHRHADAMSAASGPHARSHTRRLNRRRSGLLLAASPSRNLDQGGLHNN